MRAIRPPQHFGSVGGRPRPSPCPSAPVPRSTCVVHAIREKKDLRNYDSLEDLQAEMQNEANPNQNLFTIGGILNTLSNTAFGAERNVGSGGLRPGRPTMATLGIYVSWGIGFGYRGLLRSLGTLKARWGRRELKEEDLPPVSDEMYEQVLTLLGGVVTKVGLRKMAYRYPPFLTMSPSDFTARLLGLKELLPGCDVCFLVEDQPVIFLGKPKEVIEEKICSSLLLLRRDLAGANLNEMIMRDPEILFFPDLEAGLAQLIDLWDVDAEALSNSDAQELAFAVRSLALNKLPEGF